MRTETQHVLLTIDTGKYHQFNDSTQQIKKSLGIAINMRGMGNARGYAMLDKFAGNLQKVSDESFGRDETPRHTSHENFSQVLIVCLVTREHGVRYPSSIEGHTANILN